MLSFIYLHYLPAKTTTLSSAEEYKKRTTMVNFLMKSTVNQLKAFEKASHNETSATSTKAASSASRDRKRRSSLLWTSTVTPIYSNKSSKCANTSPSSTLSTLIDGFTHTHHILIPESEQEEQARWIPKMRQLGPDETGILRQDYSTFAASNAEIIRAQTSLQPLLYSNWKITPPLQTIESNLRTMEYNRNESPNYPSPYYPSPNYPSPYCPGPYYPTVDSMSMGGEAARVQVKQIQQAKTGSPEHRPLVGGCAADAYEAAKEYFYKHSSIEDRERIVLKHKSKKRRLPSI
eukprot:scaffold62527_cov49-Attheya_sp.AAC.6